jgi:hypothetical protein
METVGSVGVHYGAVLARSACIWRFIHRSLPAIAAQDCSAAVLMGLIPSTPRVLVPSNAGTFGVG